MAEPTVEIPTPIAPGNTDVHPGQSGTVVPPPPSGASDTAPNIPSPPQGSSDTPPSTENVQTSDLQSGDNDKLPVDQAIENVATGAGKGLGDTVAGIGTLLNKIPGIGEYLAPKEGLAAEKAAIGSPQGAAQWVGYGGENLAEFMLGDEALNGLSMADKFKQISGAMGILEKSPRLMRAIQMGADVSKATGELGEEAKAAIAKNPMLARLVGAGMDAIRQGVVAGAQETAKTGSPEKGAEQGAETGLASGVLGGAFGMLGRAAEKAGEAGTAVQEASKAGQAAPEASDLGKSLANQINDAETKMHGDFEAGIQKLKGDLGDQKVPYKGSPLQKAAQEAVQGKTESKGVLGGAFQGISGGSNEAKGLLNSLTDEKATGDLSIDELIQRRQQLGEKIGQLTRGATSSADRADVAVYQKLRDGIDQTIDNLAKTSGNPGASEDYSALRGAYKDKVKLFQAPAIQALSDPGVASDVKLDNAGKYLLSGGNKIDKVNTLAEVIGDQGVKDLGKGIIQRRLADASSENGQINPAKFVKNFKQIDALPPEVKAKLFDENTIQGGLDKLAGDLKSAANYQKLARAGVLGTVGGVGGAVTHSPIGIMLGLAGAGELGPAGELLDKIANRPEMWSAFRTAGKIGATLEKSPAARVAGTAAKYGAGSALGNIVQGASAPLSQPENDENVVYTNQ